MKITIEIDEKLIKSAAKRHGMTVDEVKQSIEEYYSQEFTTNSDTLDDILNF